jgi:hypothetical protein
MEIARLRLKAHILETMFFRSSNKVFPLNTNHTKVVHGMTFKEAWSGRKLIKIFRFLCCLVYVHFLDKIRQKIGGEK